MTLCFRQKKVEEKFCETKENALIVQLCAYLTLFLITSAILIVGEIQSILLYIFVVIAVLALGFSVVFVGLRSLMLRSLRVREWKSKSPSSADPPHLVQRPLRIALVTTLILVANSFLVAGIRHLSDGECSFFCNSGKGKLTGEECESLRPFQIEIFFEAVLLLFISSCVFLSLLAITKVLMLVVLSSVILALLWLSRFPQLAHRQFHIWLNSKADLALGDISVFFAENATLSQQLDVFCEEQSSFSDLRVHFSILMVIALVLVVMQSRRSELICRYDFIWKLQALDEQQEMQRRHAQNRLVLENVLPSHVATTILEDRVNNGLYNEDCPDACIAFITITEFSKFYIELDGNNEGVECLRLLNEIISDFDQILDDKEFACIEKIKTISTTYMAAAGLREKVEGSQHVVAIALFAIRVLDKICDINDHSFNNFNLRIGINVGGVVAGVIGTHKPHYDIWGNSVNVASRMDSSGVPGEIQITEETKNILEAEGWPVIRRGQINVKGKGIMTTYFIDHRKVRETFPGLQDWRNPNDDK